MGGIDHLRGREPRGRRDREAPKPGQTLGVLLVYRQAPRERRRVSAHIRPAVGARMPPDGHEAAFFPSHVTTRRSEVDHRSCCVFTKAVLGHAHAPDENGRLGLAQHVGQAEHLLTRSAGPSFQAFPALGGQLSGRLGKTRREPVDEDVVFPPFFEHVLEHAVEEGNVTPHAHVEKTVRHLGAEYRAFEVRGDPVTLHGRLTVGIDHSYLRARFSGVIEVFHHHRLVLGHVGAR